VKTVVIAAQHNDGIGGKKLWDDVTEHVVRPVLGQWMEGLTDETIHVNTSGSFILGGPAGDSGLSGRKNIVDSYGSAARHGGGSYSGKDPSKVDRSATYAARYVTKNIVAAGLADRVELELSYAIGHDQPLGVSVETFGTQKVDQELIQRLVREHFDLRPGAIIRDLNLRRPIFRTTAAYGHFGREDIDAPWERTDKADLLRRAAGPPQTQEAHR
jgi:S-adenosylmethionine synthetase